HGRCLSVGDLERATKGGHYALHSQRVQALCQKVAANVDAATALRRQEWAESRRLQTQSPHHPKGLPDGRLEGPGAQRPPLLLPLPAEHRHAHLRRAELTWRADHDERRLTLDTGEPLPPPLPAGAVAGVDLGEGHLAAGATHRP